MPRGLVVLVGAAALVVVVAGVRSLGGILGPVFLALILTIAVSPIAAWLRRRGVPVWLASVAGILTAFLLLAALAGSLAFAISELVTQLPAYSDQFNALVGEVTSLLGRLGVEQAQIQDALRQLDLGSVVGVLQNVLGQVAGVASDLLLIVLVILFMGMDAVNFRSRLAAISGERGDVVTALTSFAAGTRRFLWVTTAFGLVTAILDTILLLVMGIPLAFVWGLLAFITNFVPNIGFVLGLVPPALLALLEGGPGTMLLVIVLYIAINFVVESLVLPKVVGDAVGISVTLSFLALVFWAWAIGPLGALLAIPLTLMTKALLVDVDPANRWINVLIAARPPRPPEAARDEESSVDSADD
ncbi:AI-2E family transporter [Prauserella flavalba]|uniref:AI-2E family transporter n=1 Tax=Prauserella flavalba TaxID=1477506 RepID=A0A318LHU3_9PSEU|nr:AI-2E family transporter [Prauserella flavalba]